MRSTAAPLTASSNLCSLLQEVGSIIGKVSCVSCQNDFDDMTFDDTVFIIICVDLAERRVSEEDEGGGRLCFCLKCE